MTDSTQTKPGDDITNLEVTASKPCCLKSEINTKAIQVFDPPMCCSTGICGSSVDPMLVRFAADLSWLQEQGVTVDRYNLSQSPAAFVENDQVKQALTERGEAALPIVLANGSVVATGHYPERTELASWTGLATKESSKPDACCAAKSETEASGSKCCG